MPGDPVFMMEDYLAPELTVLPARGRPTCFRAFLNYSRKQNQYDGQSRLSNLPTGGRESMH